jgi:hypothetical protein
MVGTFAEVLHRERGIGTKKFVDQILYKRCLHRNKTGFEIATECRKVSPLDPQLDFQCIHKQTEPRNWCRKLLLGFSNAKVIRSAHGAGITWLDLDHVEQRYLLAGSADASVVAYDVQVRACNLAVNGLEPCAYIHPPRLLRTWGFLHESFAVYLSPSLMCSLCRDVSV